jgi:hypothetical protein
MKLQKLLLTMTMLASTACGGVLNVGVEDGVGSTAAATASQSTIAAAPTQTAALPPTQTAFPVAEATPLDTATPEMPDWTQYRSDALGVTFAYPAAWTLQLADGSISLWSPDRSGFESDPELVYFVFIGEYANLERRPFPDGVTAGFSEELKQAFQFSTVSIGDQVTYQTESLPSQAGALQVFFDDGDRYLSFGLAPYDSQNPLPGQDRHAELFKTLLQSVRLIN